jgi:hypothetical protein
LGNRPAGSRGCSQTAGYNDVTMNKYIEEILKKKKSLGQVRDNM